MLYFVVQVVQSVRSVCFCVTTQLLSEITFDLDSWPCGLPIYNNYKGHLRGSMFVVIGSKILYLLKENVFGAAADD